MGLQPSASRTALLLACPRPFDPGLEADRDDPGEPARYGSAFHQVIAACLRAPAGKPLERADRYPKEVDRAAAAYDVRRAADELAGHVKSSVGVLRNWLKRESLEVAEVEEAYGVRPREDGFWKARVILPHDDEHHYTVDPGELPGTVDLVAVNANKTRAVVVDHKTGSGESDGFARPSSIPQMRTLGLVGGGNNDVRGYMPAIEVGIFHADRRGLPLIYSEPYEPVVQSAHTVELHAALGRIGQGFLRPGPHCTRCPTRLTCPAQAADLLAESTSALVASANKLAVEPIVGPLVPAGALTLPVEERASVLYELLRKFRKLEEAGSAEIKRLVKAGVVIETREGKVLAIHTDSYETLSKKGVLEALGKVAGERELARLRKKGAIREAKRERLVGEK